MTSPIDPRVPLGLNTAQLAQLRDRWGWFLILGILLLVLGVAASVYLLAAAVATVLFVGALMVVGGIAYLIQAWRVREWQGFMFWTVGGLCYALAGAFALANPVAGAAMLTLLLGAVLIGSGALRLWVWFQHRDQPGWPWIAFSGIISLLAGLFIAFGWPGNSLELLGLILAIDLLVQGWTLVLLALRLRRGLV